MLLTLPRENIQSVYHWNLKKLLLSENCFGLKEKFVGQSFWSVTFIGRKIKTLFKISKPYDSPFWEKSFLRPS